MDETPPNTLRLQVIILSLVNPYRPHANGGSEDIRRRIETLAEVGADIQVFAIDHANELNVAQQIPHNVCLRLYPRHIDPRPWRWNYPLACIRRYSASMIADVHLILQEDSKRQQIVFLEGMQLFALWNDIKAYIPQNALTILRVHNIESRYHASVASESKGFLKLAHRLSSLQYLPLENKLLPEFDYIYAISADEAEFIKTNHLHVAENVKLVYPIPRTKELGHPEKLNGDPFVLCYFGDLTLPNNSVGLHWFCREVLPRISSGNMELRVAGKGSEAFSAYDKVSTFGFVEDLDDYLSRAHVMIAPIFSGAGVKIKVLDAVGYGKPLVTTAQGAQGFPVWLINKLCVASNVDEYVGIILKMMENYSAEVQRARALQKELEEKMGKSIFLGQFQNDIHVKMD